MKKIILEKIKTIYTMSFSNFLKKLFGNKSQRDMKEIQPYVDKINAIYPEIEGLSIDELRARTQAIMARLQDSVKEDRDRKSVV